jgi:hypothetical protein
MNLTGNDMYLRLGIGFLDISRPTLPVFLLFYSPFDMKLLPLVGDLVADIRD